jgi:hypothetical protein
MKEVDMNFMTFFVFNHKIYDRKVELSWYLVI